MRKLHISVNGFSALAVMHDDDVPATCDAIWEKLPISGKTIHANWSGRELMLHLTGDNALRLAAEGPTQETTAGGDLVYFWRAPQMSRGKQLAYSSEFARELDEIAIFYGEPAEGGMNSRDPGRDAWGEFQIATVFGNLENPSKEFLAACESVRSEGLGDIVVSRHEVGM